MKARDIRKKSLIELKEDLTNLREDLFNSQFRLGIDEAVKIGRLRGVRRDIARLLTVIKQKELAEKETAGEETYE
ncbi:MAG: 50S ribosomal protein L29 [Planctomycetota bacterium]